MSTRTFTFVFFSLLILINILFLVFGYDTVLHKLWSTPTVHPFFADIRTITGVNETLAQGFDPLTFNPGDPWNRVMNYPRIWQYIAEFFNFNQNFSIYFGIINIVLYILGLLLFSSRLILSNRMAILLLITFLSPASILVMERGNIDMIIFFLLSLSLVYIITPILFTGLIVFASVLKIFPIFAIVGVFSYSKKIFLTFFLLSTVIFIIYIILNMDDIILIKKGTPQPISLSYGMNVIWMAVQKSLGVTMGMTVKYATYLYIFGLFIITYIFTKKSQALLYKIDKTYIDAFRVGSGIYIATFLLSNNWDYRLIFLIFTLPQLVLWMGESVKVIKLTAISSIISIVFTMWYLDLHRILGIMAWVGDELSNWALFSALVFLFFITLPDWVLKFIKIRRDNERSVT
jgi:hypothetical protein